MADRRDPGRDGGGGPPAAVAGVPAAEDTTGPHREEQQHSGDGRGGKKTAAAAASSTAVTKSKPASSGGSGGGKKERRHRQQEEDKKKPKPNKPPTTSINANLLRLVTACQCHSKRHAGRHVPPPHLCHPSHRRSSDRNDRRPPYDPEGGVAPKCRRALESIRALLPMVEEKLGHRSGGGEEEEANNGGGASNAHHLASFYRSVLTATFCPYSFRLFDWGRGGREILPRVHQLFRYLSSRSIVRQTLESTAAAERRSEGGTTAGGGGTCTCTGTGTADGTAVKEEAISEAEEGMSASSSADDLSTLIAQLLHAIPERTYQAPLVRDLIVLLYDLAVVGESGLLSPLGAAAVGRDGRGDGGGDGNDGDGSGEGCCLRVSLFRETLAAREEADRREGPTREDEAVAAAAAAAPDGEEEVGEERRYEVEIPTVPSLLSLQCGVLRSLRTLLELQHEERRELSVPRVDEDEEEEMDVPFPDEEGGPFHALGNNAYLGAECGVDGDLKAALIASLRQVLLSDEGRTAEGGAGGPSLLLLSIRTKLEAAELLSLLLPELAGCGDGSDRGEAGSGGPATPFDAAALVCRAVLVHFRTIREAAPGPAGGVADGSTKGESSLPAPGLGYLSDRYASSLCALLQDAVLFPPSTSLSFEGPLLAEVASARVKVLDILLDCVRAIPRLLQSPDYFPTDHERSLCKLILRVVHLSLSGPSSHRRRDHPSRPPPPFLFFGRPSGGSYGSMDPPTATCRRQHRQVQIQARSHCSAYGVYPSLLSLVREASMTGIVVAIIACLLGDDEDGSEREGVIGSACSISWQKHAEKMEGDRGTGSARRECKNAENDPSPPLSGNKRRRLTYSAPPTPGDDGEASTASSALPLKGKQRQRQSVKQQLQIEHSPRRKRNAPQHRSSNRRGVTSLASPTSPDEATTSSVPPSSTVASRTALSSHFRCHVEDSSPVMSVARLIDDALSEARVIIRGASSVSGGGNGRCGNTNAAVLSAMTARSVSTIGGSLRLVLSLDRSCAKVGRRRCNERTAAAADRVIVTLSRALRLVADAVRYGSSGPAEARTVGPNRLKRALNVLIGVGMQIHFREISAKGSAEDNSIQHYDAGKLGNEEALIPNVESAITNAVDAISCCATSAWMGDSSLLQQLQQREREQQQGNGGGERGSSATFILDPLDCPLGQQCREEGVGISKNYKETCVSGTGRIGHERNCLGICVELCSSMGVRAPPTVTRHCVCRLLESTRRSTGASTTNCSIRQEFFANDLAIFLIEGQLPLHSRCFLLAALSPVTSAVPTDGPDDNATSGNDVASKDGENTSTLSSLCCILDPSSEVHSAMIAATTLSVLPFCISSISAKRRDSGENDAMIQRASRAKYLATLIETLQLQQYVTPYTTTQTGKTIPLALRRAAYVCFYRLLSLYTSASMALTDKGAKLTEAPRLYNFGDLSLNGQHQDALRCLMLLAETSTFGGDDPANHNGKAAPTRIGQAAYDLLVSPIVLSSEDFEATSPHVRLVKWKYAAFACHRCSPSHLRKSNAHQAVILDGRAKNEQPAADFDDSTAVKTDHGSKRQGMPTLLWLLRAPFADPDRCVRNQAASDFGSVLLGNNFSVISTLLLSDMEWNDLDGNADFSNKSDYVSLIADRLFREIDGLLYKHCCVNQSQLSFTAGMTHNGTASESTSLTASSTAVDAAKKKFTALSHQASAVRALASVCKYADLDTSLGNRLFEHALLRLIRFWIAANVSRVMQDGTMTASFAVEWPDSTSLSSITFEEICRLNEQRPLYSICKDNFIPALFSEILVPSGMRDGGFAGGGNGGMANQFNFLITFIHAFLIDDSVEREQRDAVHHNRRRFVPRTSSVYLALTEYVDYALPKIVPALVLEKDYDALRMCTGFRLYLQSEHTRFRRSEKKVHDGEPVIGQKSECHNPFKAFSTKYLNEKTSDLCLRPNSIIEEILPRLLLHPDRAPLLFFLKTVLVSEVALQHLFQPLILGVLKFLVWELGRFGDEEHEEHKAGIKDERYYVILAVKKAALIKKQPSEESTCALAAMHTDASREAGQEAAIELINENMMMLLVNVVMRGWKIRSFDERLRAVRCLKALLPFLIPEESAQYLTQVMSTINMAMMSHGDESSDSLSPTSSAAQLRCIAVSTLSQYIQIVLSHDVNTIGLNLSTIVVALFPVLELPTPPHKHNGNDVDETYSTQSTKEALKLLECLVTGQVGRQLAPYFCEVPFLPSNPALDRVRALLKANGVDFDDVLVMTQVVTQNTQQSCTARDSVASGSVSGGDGERRSRHGSQAQAALQKRLSILAKMLPHENKEVRMAVLRHLTDLLRANRGLFLRLVESEESASMRFLTVVKEDGSKKGKGEAVNADASSWDDNVAAKVSDARGGRVTAIVRGLLSRCVLETDFEARLALTTCLGEVGAIDPNRLGREVNAASAAALTNDSFEVSGYHGSWRLSQPPWNSQVIRYELQLVTHQLVVALKSATTNIDQHKIAFAIQELLALLDESAKLYGSQDKNKTSDGETDEHDDEAASATGDNKSKKDMSAWLRGKLENAGVLGTLEPYWSTNYKQSDLSNPKRPPFFTKAGTYFHWISAWCRFMMSRSHDNERSPWKRFFYACRSAIRADTSVCEFLLPLLVLDSMCFGDSLDEKVVVDELRDALSFVEDDAALDYSRHPVKGRMPRAERQKAANACFVVLDTIMLWADRETEDRYRATRGGSGSPSSTIATKGTVSSPTAQFGGSETVWPSDDSIARIDDLIKAIPLSACAQAAAAVGMHARSLRFLEMEARSHIVESVYDDIHVGDPNKHEQEKPLSASGRRSLLGRHLLHGIDLKLAQRVLGCLNDGDTVTAVSQECRSQLSQNITDHIQERELRGDWAGALQLYEQALQLDKHSELREENIEQTLSLRKGMMRSSLELGQLESVFNQATGMVSREITRSADKRSRGSVYDQMDEAACKFLMPSATEAAWRLEKWDTLEELMDTWGSSDRTADPDSQYHISFGRAMLGLHKKADKDVALALTDARTAALQSLAGAARESYTRVYPYLLRLHCLREMENANELMSSSSDLFSSFTFSDLVQSDSAQGWAWDGRMTASDVIGSSSLVNTRLALTRLFNEPALEGSLWLANGKRARKSGLFHVAENSLAHSDAALIRLKESDEKAHTSFGSASLQDCKNDVQMQYAKLNYATGQSTKALRILAQEDIDIKSLLELENPALRKLIGTIKLPGDEEGSVQRPDRLEEKVKYFGRSVLTGTEWISEGGLQSGSEIMSRHKLVQRLLPQWERGHFCFAKYLDSLLESRIRAMAGQLGKDQGRGSDDDALRASMLRADHGCQRFLLQAMKEYGSALQLGHKHVFQALPRLLTLWFDFTSIEPKHSSGTASPSGGKQEAESRNSKSPSRPSGDDDRLSKVLEIEQEKANSHMAGLIKLIPPISFYTALPQLISRVGHRDADTATVVQAILKRVLTKFPPQAMWHFAWLRNSANTARSKVGEDIFKSAQKNLHRIEDMKNHDLLEASKSLFQFLIQLAKYQPKATSARTFNVRPWKSDVELSEFVPPVQAALSIIPSSVGQTSSRENFPAFVPRMRSFCSNIQVMSSKARPKKMTAFAIPAGQSPQLRGGASSSKSSHHSQPGDAGEMHFLVKQEAKGDLRKDARVQDLNNVINRLLSGHGTSSNGGRRQRRRLHLRTFSVVCLSEDCGILEWVPNTDSLRNLVCRSYNPQAAPHSSRRRGRRIGNFGDITLRNNYTKCQDMYFKNGNLTRAAELFEDTCLKPYPPVLYWWFMHEFLDSHAWFEARMAFTLSAATWSAVGHVIGLGDRHSENILVDTSTGDCVHVDFDCIFDKGLHLPRPEVVPFRLTPNMLDAFGPTGAEGAFSGGLTTAMSTLRDNRDTLLSVLEPFLKDPVIDWKRHRNQQKQKQGKAGTSTSEAVQAKRSINVIQGRLDGVYNLRNPNARKFRRTDGHLVDHDDDMTHMLPLSVEGQVHKMISEAMNSENLVQTYIGWMPWL